ncbi:MAG TPA: cation:proton antiporter [Terriglobales bacterium]|nr:cation:proton antiporter [Terriglobales bacterium]
MPIETHLYRDLALVFVAAVAGGTLAHRLRQPLILGYVLGGMLIGQFTPGPRLSDTHSLELLAEIGVILLMYSIGIEFSLRDLLRVKWVALLGAPLGILLSIALGIGIGHLLGWTILQGIIVGAVISVASTMVLSRLLLDRGELHSPHGRVMIGITLMEDMAVVIMTVLIPVLGTAGGNYWPVAWAVGKALLLLIPLAFAAARLVPHIMTRVARIRSEEMYVIVALAIGFAIAAATQAIGLSLALGAFIAGMVISGSEYKHQTLAQLLPLRDSFVALFFVTIGALIDPRALFSNPSLLATMVLLILAGKFLIWTLVVRLFRYPLVTALLVGVGLTQIGEFSYVLVQSARRFNLVESGFYNATLAASLITILVNAGLTRLAPRWLQGHQQAAAARSLPIPASIDPHRFTGHVVLCGFGRVGSAVGIALETFHLQYVAIELDPDVVRALHARGIPAIYGDPSHATVLESAAVSHASLVVVTLPDKSSAELAVRTARAGPPRTHPRPHPPRSGWRAVAARRSQRGHPARDRGLRHPHPPRPRIFAASPRKSRGLPRHLPPEHRNRPACSPPRKPASSRTLRSDRPRPCPRRYPCRGPDSRTLRNHRGLHHQSFRRSPAQSTRQHPP